VLKINHIAVSRVLLVFFIALCFLFFYYFLQPAIKSWDEAVYAGNAIEMSKKGDWWVMYNNGQPDFFNTKPPLVIWLQSIFISLFGLNEFAIRLPSFISLCCIVIFLYKFLERLTGNLVFPFFTINILLSSYGFLGFHGFATGDLDATLCLCITIYSLLFFDKILLTSKTPSPQWIYLIGFFFFLAFLTKSTAAFLPLPGLLIALFIFRKQKTLFRNKHFYISLLAISSFIIGYYFFMEINNPGYFSHAWRSEFERIYKNIMVWHAHPFKYYFQNLITRFYPWIWVLLPSLLLALLSKSVIVKKTTLFSFIFSICYFLIISIPSVKLEWYDIPAYPFLSIIASVTFFELYNKAKISNKLKNKAIVLLGFILFITTSYFFMVRVIKKIMYPFYMEPLEREGTALRKLIHEPAVKNLKILMYAKHPEHYNQLNFYREMYFRYNAFKPAILKNVQDIYLGDTILVCQTEKIILLKDFDIDTIQKINSCLLIHIKGKE